MRRLFWGLGLGLALASCGGSAAEDADGDGFADGVYAPNNVTVVTPVKPTGHVAGVVLDFTTGLPLPGAQVALTGGGQALLGTTDGQGAFVFGPIPSTRYAVRVTVGGYSDALVTAVEIPSAAGQFPVENASVFVGPIGLMPTGGELAIQLVSDRGVPVSGAQVMVETAARYYLDGSARGSVVGRGETDAAGRVTITALPDVRALPPRLADQSGLVVQIEPADLDGDMIPDLRGKTVALGGAEIRASARPFTIVLDGDDPGAFTIIASSIPRLRGPSNTPSIVDPTAPIRVVFSRPIDRDALAVDLRDETGEVPVAVATSLGALGSTLEITPMNPLANGQEYNLALRVRSAPGLTPATLEATAPFFVRADSAQGLTAVGNFVDSNGDTVWGSGDVLRVIISRPIGKPSGGFSASLWVNIDLNGSGVTGDGPGELPPMGAYPAAIPVAAREPLPANGAGASGYTRVLDEIPMSLVIPRMAAEGPVQFEVRFEAGATDAEGRTPPTRITGVATLVSR